MAYDNKYTTTPSLELIRRLAAEGDRVFDVARAAELAPGAGVSRSYLNEALHHLAKAGWIVRLKKGLYAVSSAVPGVLPVHEYEVAMALVRPAAISHWSAMLHHGLTDQVPGVVYVLTTAKSVPTKRGGRGSGRARNTRNTRNTPDTRDARHTPALTQHPHPGPLFPVGDFRFRFVRTRPERFFGTEAVWVRDSRVTVTDPERTLLDGLITPQHCGGIGEVLHAFELRGGALDVPRIVDYALRLDTATAKRLGWVLERRGVPPHLLAPLAAAPTTNTYPLDVDGADGGPTSRRWRVRENLPGYLE